jgi:excisionase family DNA binding protein
MQSKNSEFEPLVDVEKLTESVPLHRKTIMRMARENRIPAIQIGRYWFFRLSEIDAWLRSGLKLPSANSCV